MSENKNETGSQTSSLDLVEEDLKVKHKWRYQGALWFLYDRYDKFKAVVGRSAAKGPLSCKFTIFYYRKLSGLQAGPLEMFDDVVTAKTKAEEMAL